MARNHGGFSLWPSSWGEVFATRPADGHGIDKRFRRFSGPNRYSHPSRGKQHRRVASGTSYDTSGLSSSETGGCDSSPERIRYPKIRRRRKVLHEAVFVITVVLGLIALSPIMGTWSPIFMVRSIFSLESRGTSSTTPTGFSFSRLPDIVRGTPNENLIENGETRCFTVDKTSLKKKRTPGMDAPAEEEDEEQIYQKCLPTVFFIGASKCGTTSLSNWMSAHPRLHFSSPVPNHSYRETHIFDYTPELWEKSSAWEVKHRLGARAESTDVVMDFTPNYIFLADTPHRISNMYGGTGGLANKLKFLVLLREPVARTISSWIYKSDPFTEPLPFYKPGYRSSHSRRRGLKANENRAATNDDWSEATGVAPGHDEDRELQESKAQVNSGVPAPESERNRSGSAEEHPHHAVLGDQGEHSAHAEGPRPRADPNRVLSDSEETTLPFANNPPTNSGLDENGYLVLSGAFITDVDRILEDHPDIKGFVLDAKQYAAYGGQTPEPGRGQYVGWAGGPEPNAQNDVHPFETARKTAMKEFMTERRSLADALEEGYERVGHLAACIANNTAAGLDGQEPEEIQCRRVTGSRQCRGSPPCDICRKITTPRCDPRNFVEDPIYNAHVAKSMYAMQLKRWFKIFGRENFKVMFTDDLEADPVKVLEDALKFIGLDMVDSRGIKGLRSREAWQEIVKVQFNRGDDKKHELLDEQVTPELMESMFDFFEPHNRELEALLGVRLPASWYRQAK